MASDWRTVSIGEVAEVIGGGTPSSTVLEYWGGEIPWITPKDLSSHFEREIERGERNISKLGLKKSSARLLPRRTLLLTSRAPIGYVAIAKNEVCTNQGFKSLVLNDAQSPEFFYYLIKHNIPALEAHASGSTFKEISGSVLKQIELTIPSLKTQKSIAQILGSLDDKIELNRKMNTALEGMALALFKSWFVDFDPVIDNALAAGNPIPEPLQKRAATRKALGPNRRTLPADIQKLFPNSFVFTEELGWIPEGWEVSTLGQEYKIVMGQSPKGDTYNETGAGTLFYQGRAEFGWRYPSPRLYTTNPLRMAQKGDVLMSVRAPVGDFNLALDDCCVGRGLCAMSHNSESSTFSYYQMLETKKYLEKFNGEGTVFGSINQKDLKSIPCLTPSKTSIMVFIEIAKELDLKIEVGCQNNISTANLRDALIPKLLSGELRIPDAEKLIQEGI